MKGQPNPKVAVLGATGYIGRSLLAGAKEFSFEVAAFSRNVIQAKAFLGAQSIHAPLVLPYKALLSGEYDIVINATGIGSPKKLSENPSLVFSVIEEMDTLLAEYLKKHPDARVFNISSGSVYGLAADGPITDTTNAIFNLRNDNSYAVAKLMSEVKHRADQRLAIIDLRVFAFVSRFLDTEDSFLVSEIAKCLQDGTTLYTTPANMVRDYITAHDVWHVVQFLCEQEPQNEAFDMQSAKPVSKIELLEYIGQQLGLVYEFIDSMRVESPTGQKTAYYSESEKLSSLGYRPTRTSLEIIESELRALLKK